MQVRTATLNDVPALVDLWVEFMDFHTTLDPDFVRSEGSSSLWTEYIISKLDDETHRILVAVVGNKLAGYLVAVCKDYPPIRTIEKFGYIQEIGVASQFRQQGVGRQLVQAAEDWLHSVGVPQIEVKIYVENEASQRLFRSLGFVCHTETLIKKRREEDRPERPFC